MNINQFPPINFSTFYELYSQWVDYIEVHAPDLLLSVNCEDSKDEEEMPPCMPYFN